MLPLQNYTIALAEGRQLEDLAGMLEKEGANVIRCPMVSILDAPEEGPVLAWLRDLTAGRMDWVILMTGEALRRLLGFAERSGFRDEVTAALKQTRILTRGPKPMQALREIGLTPTKVAEAPTTAGVIATLRHENLSGKTVGLTLYGDANPTLEQFLKDAGAEIRTVLSYVYAPATDAGQVAELIENIAGGKVDVLVFTSSPQVDRLYEVGEEKNIKEKLKAGLQRARIAAVGPIVADNLRQRGAKVDFGLDRGFVMKNLVQRIKREMGRE